MVDLVIRNCKIVIPTAVLDAGIACEDGKIVQISGDAWLPEADRIIDAKGNLVLPGVIDSHVHFRELGKTAYQEDWSTGSAAAAVGGATTVFEMPSHVEDQYRVRNVDVFNLKSNLAKSKSIVDFGLYGIITSDDLGELSKLAAAGVIGFKIYLGLSASNTPVPTDGEIVDSFLAVSKTGRRIAVHAENGEIIEHNERRMRAAGRTDVLAHLESRPDLAEAEAISRVILFSEATGASVQIAHMSSKEGVDLVVAAKARGLHISAETAPHYLLLSSHDYTRVGSMIKVNPPVRYKADSERLWAGLLNGTIDCLGSDHAPYTREEKVTNDVWAAKSGFIGVETSVPLMLTQVNANRLSLEKFVQVTSENAARLFGIYPRKGALIVGSDCDVTIVDLKKESVIRSENLHSKNNITPFEGWKVKGIPIYTIVRGNVVMDHGQIVSKPVGAIVKPNVNVDRHTFLGSV